MTDLRLWEPDNELVEEWYKKENIIVEDVGNGNKCYMFFSSHNLFFPNTVEAFEEMVVIKNYFEGRRMASSGRMMSEAGRFIFLRDIYKQFYYSGINSEINTHDKLIEKLRELSDGYRVITYGSCGGGYMAALVGALLNAEACFDVAGWITPETGGLHRDFCIRMTGSTPEEYLYRDIRPFIEKSRCVFYYFYPMYNESDRKRYETVSNIKNVYGFAFNQKNHASTMMVGNMPYIVSRDKDYMMRLYKRYKGRVINFLFFFFCTSPVSAWIPVGLKEARMFMKRRLGK